MLASDQNADGSNRSNDLAQRIDLGPLGSPSRNRNETSMSYAALVSTPLGKQEASELVVTALDHMALDGGFLDAHAGLTAIRPSLGLPDLDR
jgi:hypothetical protein